MYFDEKEVRLSMTSNLFGIRDADNNCLKKIVTVDDIWYLFYGQNFSEKTIFQLCTKAKSELMLKVFFDYLE